MPLETRLEKKDAWETDADLVVVGVLESEKGAPLPRSLASDDARTQGAVAAAWARGEFRGKKGELTLVTVPGGSRRLALLGLGATATYGAEACRVAGGFLCKLLRGKAAKVAAVRLSTLAVRRLAAPEAAAAFSDGAALASYEFTKYKATPKPLPVETLVLAQGKELSAAGAGIRRALDRQQVITSSVLWSRDIGNLAADTATPAFLAEQASTMGAEVGLKVTVYAEEELREMGCGGILAVGGGSNSHPPRMIVLEHEPARAKGGRKVALVGKGITFDSGGISIKPAAAMSEMKFDKSGAVAVLATMRAVALLKLPVKVVGVMCCAENVPSGTSYRPGDLVRSFNGKVMEILNTDAEGRVVLSDGLGWVTATHKPDEIIDLATLTGACVVALGFDNAGLVSNNDALAERLLKASKASGEPLWRLPMTQVHQEMVKSEVGDIKNSTEVPPAGTLTAAAFLSNFVGETPWAHLDIAGVAYVTAVSARYVPPYHPGGFNGFGIRLLCEYLANGS